MSTLFTTAATIITVCVCVWTCRLNEGETVIRTLADYWVVARKNGHRRFFVLFTQKDVNFAEVNGNESATYTPHSYLFLLILEEVRKICQKEFSNIYFFD